MIVPQTQLEVGMAAHCSILGWRIPTDRGAWPATVHRVPKSQTWLKRLTYIDTHTQKCPESPIKSKIHNGQPNRTMSNHIIRKGGVTWQRLRSLELMTLTWLPTIRLTNSAGRHLHHHPLQRGMSIPVPHHVAQFSIPPWVRTPDEWA